MKQEFIISAVGPNIVGVVASISEEILACGCNFEGSGMSVLGNHSALMIHVTGETVNLFDDLRAACERLREKYNISFALFPLDTSSNKLNTELKPNYELKVKGTDRIGIVYRTSQLLASRNINIINLQTNVSSSPVSDISIFTLRTQILVPPSLGHEKLSRDLQSLAEDMDDVISLKWLYS